MRTKNITILIAILLLSNMTQIVKADSPVDFVQTWTTNTGVGWTVPDMQLAPGVLVLEQYRYSPDYNNDTLYGLDIRNGKLLWNITALDGGGTGLIGSTVHVGGDTGLTGSNGLLFAVQYHPSPQSARLLAIDPLSGRIVWSADRPWQSANFLVGDTILTYRINEGIAAYDASTGALKWALPKATAPLSSTYGDGVMFVVEYAQELSQLLALDPSSGVQIWARTLAWSPDCFSFANGTLFGEDFSNSQTVSHSLSVIGLNASDGGTLWNATYPYFNQSGTGCPALENGQLFFMTYPPYSANATAQVVAISTSTGSEQWRHTLACIPDNSEFGCYLDVHIDSAAVGDDLVFVADGSWYSATEYNATVYALGTASGNVVWAHTFPGATDVRMIYDNGTLYTSADGRIAAFSSRGVSTPEFPSTLALVTFAVAVVGVRLMMKRREES